MQIIIFLFSDTNTQAKNPAPEKTKAIPMLKHQA
jgi:hypothetical protein